MTAARLHGFRLPADYPARLDVATPSPGRAPRTGGTSGHELPAATPVVTLENGLRVSAAVDTWCQISRRLRLDDLIAAGDGLVCRRDPVATLAELVEAVMQWAGRPGAPRLRRALAKIRSRTDSARETRLRLMIVRAGFREPMVNFAILNNAGGFLGYGDLCYPEARVVLEYDGAHHRDDEAQYHRDIERLDAIMAAGWRVIRVNKSLIERPAVLFATLREALAR